MVLVPARHRLVDRVVLGVVIHLDNRHDVELTLQLGAFHHLEKAAGLDLFPFGITDGFQLFAKRGHFSHFTLFLGGLINHS
ncbi:hypothetical protein D9M73_286880 [compost metagenome]